MIASAQAEKGKVSEAKMTLDQALQIKDDETAQLIPGNKIPVIEVLAAISDVPAALSLALNIEDSFIKDHALRQIAYVQAHSGQYAGALQTADLVEREETRTKIILAIAVKQVWAGRLQEAQETAIEIEHDETYITFLARLAEEQSENSDQAGAKKVI